MIKDIVRAYRNYPDHVAFVIDDTSYTYQEVFARVQGIMPFVQDCPEDIIGIIAEDCIETYASILSVLLSGKTYVILHPNYPDSRNRTIACIIRSRIRYTARPPQRDQMYFNIRATG